MIEVRITAEMEDRLAAAEKVCLLFGWITSTQDEFSDALTQAWIEWADLATEQDASYLHKNRHTEITEDIPRLGAKRRATREAVLAQLRSEQQQRP